MSVLRRGKWFSFSRGAIAGAIALFLNFLIRLGGFAPFPPEAAIEKIISVIPASIQEPAVQQLGDLAGLLGLFAATVVAIFVYGLLSLLFETFLERISIFKRLSQLEKFLVYSPVPWLFFGLIVFPLAGESLFGISSSFASASSALVFPLTLLLIQLVFCWILHFEYRGKIGSQFVNSGNVQTQPNVVPVSRAVSRRELIEKGALAVVSVAFVILSLDSISSVLFHASSELPTGSRFTISGTPAIFGDPRLQALVDSEVTSNDSFYRVAIDIVDPTVNSSTWSLKLAGLIANDKSYSLVDLQKLPSVNQYTTFECVSNNVNGNLISNAKWTGVRLSDLFADAGGVDKNTQYVVFYSVDNYSVGIPIAKAMMSDCILAYQMNDQSLPQKHGFPVRAVIPGLYGMMSAKWVDRIELVDSAYSGYWQTRGWSNDGTVQTLAFITVPGDGASVSLSQYNGSVMLGGVAFAGDRGVSKVEISVDGGQTWQEAQLKPAISKLTWVLWAYEWFPAETGTYTLYARATDGTGATQTSQETSTFPNGATGYVTILANVKS